MTAQAGETTEPELLVVADLDAVAAGAAERIAAALADSVRVRGRADWATTGGSIAPAIYQRLAVRPLRDLVPWSAVHVWWGDDRYVPRDHPLSNVKPLDDILLAGAREPVPLSIDNLHPFPTTIAIELARGAAWCAAELAAELRTADLEWADDWPVLDLVVVGIGADGHLLSVFPGSAALESSDLALAIPAPTHIDPQVERVTLNPTLLGVAHQVLVVAGGAGKAAVLADILWSERDPSRWPAQLARRAGATWIVDTAAAARLRR